MNKIILNFFYTCFFLYFYSNAQPPTPSKYWVYIATSKNSNNTGIITYEWNPTTTHLKKISHNTSIPMASFLAISKNNKYLYSVGNGKMSAFKINSKNGILHFINSINYAKEKGGYISISNNNKYLLSSLYRTGAIASYSINNDGSIQKQVDIIHHKGHSSHPKRQNAPHPHMTLQHKNSDLVFAPDLGIDKIKVYQLSDSGKFSPAPIPSVSVTPGSGCRFMSFHPTKNIAYILNELTSTIVAYNFDPNKGLTTLINTINLLPKGYKGINKAADIHVSKNGNYIYASNRGHNSIAICKIDNSTGGLHFLTTVKSDGEIPREFEIDPTGTFLFVANQKSNNISIFSIDNNTGLLSAINKIDTPSSPMGIRFVKQK